MSESFPIKVLLVDDQPIVGETLRQMLANEPGIEFRFCPEPSKAIAIASEFRPTVILQDLVMPDVDGLQLVRFYRANTATRDTPLVVLSSKEEAAIKAKAFALGANDYMVKLPDRLEVLARIRYHSRGYIALLERNEAYAKLAESQRELAAEVNQAARYVKSLLPKYLTGPVSIEWRFIPSTQLGGDMFGYHWLDRENLAMFLLDVSGHGVGSSLLAVSAANLLTAQSLPGVDCRDAGPVLTKLNDIFQMDRQDNKYFTIWYGVYRPADRSLAWSNGGHPAALLYQNGGLNALDADGLAIGMIPDMSYATHQVIVEPGAQLLLYSDGAYEIEKEDGKMWEFNEFVTHMTAHREDPGPVLDRHIEFIRRMRNDQPLGDDCSMMDIRFAQGLLP